MFTGWQAAMAKLTGDRVLVDHYFSLSWPLSTKYFGHSNFFRKEHLQLAFRLIAQVMNLLFNITPV
jgi:hypothetical protein